MAFRSLCEEKFASIDGTWRALLQECLKSNFEAKLRKVEFTQAARMIGFRGNPDVVFEACDVDQEHSISAWPRYRTSRPRSGGVALLADWQVRRRLASLGPWLRSPSVRCDL
mmetsp:Transcript_59158/g.190272  ORF Transcript_59158/g.190272 Transcript_59158/m.190272 type:complete len:112 (+) Transcript_59158:117-452(+)